MTKKSQMMICNEAGNCKKKDCPHFREHKKRGGCNTLGCRDQITPQPFKPHAKCIPYVAPQPEPEMPLAHSPLPWRACNDGKCSCKQIWCSDYPIAFVNSGDWGDDYPSIRLVGESSLDLKAEAYMEQCTYGHIPEELALANIKFIIEACNSYDPAHDQQVRKAFAEECIRTMPYLKWTGDPDPVESIMREECISHIRAMAAKEGE